MDIDSDFEYTYQPSPVTNTSSCLFCSDIISVGDYPISGFLKTIDHFLVSDFSGRLTFYCSRNLAHPVREWIFETGALVTCLLLLKLPIPGGGEKQYLVCGHLDSITLWSTQPLEKCRPVITTLTPVIKLGQINCPNFTYLCACIGTEVKIYKATYYNEQCNWEQIGVHTENSNLVGISIFKNLIATACSNKAVIFDVNDKVRAQYVSCNTITTILYYGTQIVLGHENGKVLFLEVDGSIIKPVHTVTVGQGSAVSKIIRNNKNLVLVGTANGSISGIDLTNRFELKFELCTQGSVRNIIVSGGYMYSVSSSTIEVWCPMERINRRIQAPEEEVLQITISPFVRVLNKEGCIIDQTELIGSYSTGELLTLNKISEMNGITNHHKAAERVLYLLQKHFVPIPEYDHTKYKASHKWTEEIFRLEFLQMLGLLCFGAIEEFQKHPMLVSLQSPAYILGDLHGSYKDLAFFSKKLWILGIDFIPSKIVFLGDYVDRGPHSIEVVSHLFALKILYPQQVFLIRGNHEFMDINGKKDCHASFRNQCIAAMGSNTGDNLWRLFNQVFDWMPLAAIIDDKMFCCHGGIPRIIHSRSDILEQIKAIDRPLKDVDIVHDSTFLALDLLWSDPAPTDVEGSINSNGFGENPNRGENIKVFGKKALDQFNSLTGCTHLIRAHQPPRLGVYVSKNARVITVFSSSHYCGKYNSAAVVFVNKSTVKVAVTCHSTDETVYLKK